MLQKISIFLDMTFFYRQACANHVYMQLIDLSYSFSSARNTSTRDSRTPIGRSTQQLLRRSDS